MTAPADDHAAEEAFEAHLEGRRPAAGSEGLIAFADAVRMSAAAPGRPSPALAQLLAAGLVTDRSGSPDGRKAVAEAGARRSPAPSRKSGSRLLATALAAKVASAGLLAKAATAAGVAVVGLSTAGFLGGLPAPVQHTFATMVDEATPFTAPDPATSPAAPSTTAVAPSSPDDAAVVPASPQTAGPTGARPSNVGQAVSSVAQSSTGVDGRAVSSMAHQRNSSRAAAGSTPASPTGAAHPTGSSAATAHQPAGATKGRGAAGVHGNH